MVENSMSWADRTKLVVTGAPMIGEGNIVDTKSVIAILRKSNIPCTAFYPKGPFVRLGSWFHKRMTMSTKRTMDYVLTSERVRSSLMVMPLKRELKRAVKKTHEQFPDTACFITSQNMLAEEAVEELGGIPTISVSSDVRGKITDGRNLSESHRNIIHFVWNSEAFHILKDELKLPDVHLIRPVDPGEAFEHRERDSLPVQEALYEPDLCFIKLSGSGGDPLLIRDAINSLWTKSRVRSIVFPGTESAGRRIMNRVNEKIIVFTSLDTSVFYNLTREMISNQHMLLTYPSEQVKYITILTSKNVFPKVVWLPPRGQHEMINLAWAIKHGLSGTVCIPAEYQGIVKSRLIDLGVRASDIEFAEPGKLSAAHFKPSPVVPSESSAPSLETVVMQIINSC